MLYANAPEVRTPGLKIQQTLTSADPPHLKSCCLMININLTTLVRFYPSFWLSVKTEKHYW